jgi:hypothetical protein|tara:strand:- start:33 stop:311 length:279 start_codon:yes stop_codon:yes gene_type:complete
MKTETMIEIESVGSIIDSNGITYPMMVDGGYDKDGGIHIHDIENEEWFESLSEKDLEIVGGIIDSLKSERELFDFDEAMNGELDHLVSIGAV